MRFRRLLVLAPAFPDRSNRDSEGVFVKEQVNYLKKYFSEIHVIAPNTIWRRHLKKKIYEDYNWDNVKVHYPIIANLPVPYLPDSCKGLWLDRQTKKILEFLSMENISFDLIHAHYTWYPGAVAVKIKEKLDVPVVVTEPTSITLNKALEKNDPYFIKTWSQCDAVIRVNNKDVPKIREFNNNTVGIPYGYDEEIFCYMDKEACRQKESLPGDMKIVLTVGSLDEVKGQKYLIEAMREIVNKRKDVLCLIVGSGPLKSQLQKMITEFELENFVMLKGFVFHEHLPTLMNSCDFFVLPSLSEGNPTVMFEALGCGLPFLGTKVGGIPEVINSEDYGYVFDPADSGRLSQAMLLALNREWDKKVIIDYAKKFSRKNIAEQIISVYESIEQK